MRHDRVYLPLLSLIVTSFAVRPSSESGTASLIPGGAENSMGGVNDYGVSPRGVDDC